MGGKGCLGDAVRRGTTVGDGLGGIGMSGDKWSMPRDTVCYLRLPF